MALDVEEWDPGHALLAHLQVHPLKGTVSRESEKITKQISLKKYKKTMKRVNKLYLVPTSKKSSMQKYFHTSYYGRVSTNNVSKIQ